LNHLCFLSYYTFGLWIGSKLSRSWIRSLPSIL